MLAQFSVRFQKIIIASILTLITILVYLRTLQYPFQFDDLPNIVNYTKLKIANLSALFFSSSRWVCVGLNTIIYKYFDSSALACRVINLAFHLTAGLILFWLLSRWLQRSTNKLAQSHALWLTSLVTGLFLLHPVQSQTVCYIIQGQLEGLASLLILTCLALYELIASNQNHKNIRAVTLTILLLITLSLAASTKEIAIITPILILLSDWFWIAQGKLSALKSRIQIHLLTFIATAAVYLYYLKSKFFLNLILGKATVQSSVGNVLSATGESMITQSEFIRSQFKVLLHYLYIIIYPGQICIEYDWQLTSSWLDWDCLIPGLIWLVIGIGLLILGRKDKTHPILFGSLWFLTCTLPRSLVPSGELLVDYKTYLANIGWILILGYFIVWLCHRYLKNKLAQASLLIIILSGYSVATWFRTKVWSSQRAFWGDVIHKAPRKARGFNNYGMSLVETGELDQAIFYFKKAIELNRFNHKAETFFWDPYINLANVYAMQHQIDLAINLIKKGLLINSEIADLHNNLGALLEYQKQYPQAIMHLQKALQLKPNTGQSMCTLGKIYLATDQPKLAYNWLKQACQNTHMDRIPASLQLFAEASIKTQAWSDAVWALEKLLQLQPTHMESWINLGSVYYFTGNKKSAQACYRKAAQLSPTDPRVQKMLSQF